MGSDDIITAARKRHVIRSSNEQRMVLENAYHRYAGIFNDDILEELANETNLEPSWIKMWLTRQRKKDRKNLTPLASFKNEIYIDEDCRNPPDAPRRRRVLSTSLEPDAYARYPSPALTTQLPVSSVQQASYSVSARSYSPYPNSHPMSTPSLSRPRSVPTGARVTQNRQSPYPTPYKHLKVLQDRPLGSENVSDIDLLLDEHLLETDPFQAAMGLVYLRRMGLRW